MIPSLMLSVLLAVAAPASPLPQPAPTLPPIIIHTVTTETCTTLQNLVLPVGYVARHNDAAFRSMAISTQKFLSHIMPGDVPSAADLQAALGGPNGMGASVNGTGTPLSAQLSSSEGDDSVLYGPGQILSASRIDAVAQQIYENITLERQYLKESLQQFPPGTNPSVDALRQSANDLVVLQNALANRYEQFASTYLGNMNVAGMTQGSVRDPNAQSNLGTFKIALRGILLGDTQGLAAVAAAHPGNDANFGYKNVDQLAADASNGEVVTALRAKEYQFTSTLLSTYNQCHATNYVLAPPSSRPAPTATP